MEKCPLTNLPCPHKKTTHVTEVGPNYTCLGEKHMCFICSSTAEVEKDPFIEILTAVGKKVKERKEKSSKKCSCGFSLNDLIDGEKLGCAECYVVFQEELQSLIQRLHRSSEHKGKTPKNIEALSKERLEKELKEAVDKEDYEKAKIIKDKLDQLK